jgi:hypothetical protein
MNAISYSDVFELEHDVGDGGAIAVGDIVRAGPNLSPKLQVIALHSDMAWVRNMQSGLNALMPLARCRKVTDA